MKEWIERNTKPFREAPLTTKLRLQFDSCIWPTATQPTNFLAATALVLDLTLVTADVKLLGLGKIATLANR